MKNKYIFVAALLTLISALSFATVKLAGGQHAKDSEFVIVTSFYPVYIAAINITDGIENVTVRNLTEPSTGCLHDYQLTTADMKLLEQADLLVINGGGMEAFLDDAMKQFPDLKIIDASKNIPLLAESAEGNEDEEALVELQIKEEHLEEEGIQEGHAHGTKNAHVWLNIDYYQQQIETIEHALSQLDQANSSTYQHNAAQYMKELDKLKEMAAAIKKENPGPLILFHEAFAYLANMCELETATIINMDEESALSAAKAGEAVDLAKTKSVNYILSDQTYGKKAALTIAKETGAKIIYLDPLVSGAYDKNAYLQGMKKNLAALGDAFL